MPGVTTRACLYETLALALVCGENAFLYMNEFTARATEMSAPRDAF